MEFGKKTPGKETKSTKAVKGLGRRGMRSHLASRSITSGSNERISKIVDTFKDVYENTEEIKHSGLEIKITPMPKVVYGDDYDVVVISATETVEVGDSNVKLTMVVPIVLEDNSNVLTPRKVVQEQDLFFDKTRGHYIRASRKTNDDVEFYLPTEVLEENLAANIAVATGNTDPDTKIVRLDGVMLPAYADLEDEEILYEFAGRGIDPILDYWNKLTTDEVVSISRMCEENKIRTNFFTHNKGNKDVLGVTLDDTFTLEVSLIENTKDRTSGPNSRGRSDLLLSVNGVVALAPGVVDVEIDGRVKETLKLIPNVIARNVTTSYILEDALLSIGALSAITTENRWMDILLDTTGPMRDPGLSLQAIGLDPKPFSKKGVSRSAKEDILFKHCIEGAMVSLDIPEYSLMSGAFSVIQAAAAGDKMSLKEIITTAVKMCDKGDGTSGFDPKFPIDDILESVELPSGYFENENDKSKHALGSIDLDYICATHPKFVDAYIEAETSGAILDMIAIYNDIGLGKARLTGIRRRVTFSTTFLNELLEGLSSCGFSLTMDPTQTYKKTSGRGFDRKRTRKFAGSVDSRLINTTSGDSRTNRGRASRSFIKRRY